MSLLRWGWNSYFETMWANGERGNAVAARVIAQHRKYWRVAGDFGEFWAEAAGKLRLAAEEGAEWPAVGDWVAVELQGANSAAAIRAVLPRRSRFVRKSPGKQIQEQVIAANVDTALLVSAVDGDFNPRRVERYLAQCWESGARAVIVLNKADVCTGWRDRAREMERAALGTSVCVVSAKTEQGLDELKKFLTPAETVTLLGSSGVGKSTIVNRLLGEALQVVQPVREGDSRGRHTTSTRELFVSPGGALVIDTPGLRELQLWDADEGVSRAFAEIDSLGAQCRFSDCRHEAEPGCAVQAALEAGTLDEARFENHRKLLREQEFLRRKIDAEARQLEKQRVKEWHREQRKIYRRDKFSG